MQHHLLRFVKQLPTPILLICSGMLLAFVLSGVVSHQLIANKLDELGNQYGNALANLVAKQAIDATLSHDLVSLQVILSDAAENAQVVNATIHDVENNLLVQAGRATGVHPQQRNFTAPIALHDSIAGYVTVSVNFSDTLLLQQQLTWLFSLTAVLLLALTTAAYYFGRSPHAPMPEKRSSIPIVASPEPQPTVAESPPDYHSVELLLHFHNLHRLNLQLNGSRFKSLLRRLEKQLQGILTLYNGELVNMDLNSAVIRFDGPVSVNETLFQAVCSAQLFLTLNEDEKELPLLCSAVVQPCNKGMEKVHFATHQSRRLSALNELLTETDQGHIFIDHTLLSDDELSDKIDYQNTDGNHESKQSSSTVTFVRILNILDPYKELLSKQLDKLKITEEVA